VWDETYRYSGMHRDGGVFIASGPGVRAGERFDGASLVDLAPTALYWLGLDVPEDMDGRPLTAIMSDEHLAAHPVRIGGDASDRGDVARHDYDRSEEEEIMDRLRDLGYMN
jgi:arylsulfatase A-like enzyme